MIAASLNGEHFVVRKRKAPVAKRRGVGDAIGYARWLTAELERSGVKRLGQQRRLVDEQQISRGIDHAGGHTRQQRWRRRVERRDIPAG